MQVFCDFRGCLSLLACMVADERVCGCQCLWEMGLIDSKQEGSRQQAAGSRQQTADSKQQTAGSMHQSGGIRQYTSGSRQQTASNRQ